MNHYRRSLPFLAGSLLLLLALVFSAFSLPKPTESAKEEIRWLTLEEAYALNQKAPKKIFVDVYTDWCGWCKRMDKDTFGDPKVAEFVNKNYYAVKLNAESDRSFKLGQAEMTERMVARQFGVKAYPTVVFIYEDFRTIEPVPGYHQADPFLNILKDFAARQLTN